MKNLVVCRGQDSSNVMIGPCDYFGSLENIQNKWYSIKIVDNVISFYQAEPELIEQNLPYCTNFTLLKGEWISHSLENSENSLFPKPGILKFTTTERIIHIPKFDATRFNLQSFGARMVLNDSSFQMIENDRLQHYPNEAYDDLRVISYKFGPHYTNYQFQTNGLFLEHHKFIQTMTPLNETASGFVLLARLINDYYFIIAVPIPFGYTLILDPDCIHGDSTLCGYYCMCMTSNHTSMATANTVFLRNSNDETILFKMNEDVPRSSNSFITCKNLIYNYPGFAISSIFNPFAKGYWKYPVNGSHSL
jgi:hypothetical protein